MVTTLTVLKSIHVLAAALWIGGALLLNVAVTLAMRADGPEARITTLRLTRFSILWVFAPLAAIVFITGIWLTEEYYDPSDLWISLGMTGWLIAVIVMLAVIWPRAGRMLAALEGGDPPLSPKLAVYSARFNLVLLSAVLVIMVIRPT
ncbi:MAG: DUF2269 family protein [Solirubrobacterales bacterium]